MRKFDVVILGGGPAGLMIGSELCKKHKVLIIDKSVIGETNHTWIYWSDRIKENGLEDFTTLKLKSASAESFKGSNLRMVFQKINKFLPALSENKVMDFYKNKFLVGGGTCISDCLFKNLVLLDNSIEVNSSKGRFTTNLVVDAMGYDSPLVKKYEVVKSGYFMPVYGLNLEPIGLPKLEYNFIETLVDKTPLPY